MYEASESRIKKARYRGFRHVGDVAQVCKVTGASAFDWENLKPTIPNEPFDWGYGGVAAAALALAILADYYNAEFAVEHANAFKWKVICKLPQTEWVLTAQDIETATSVPKEKS